MLKKSRKACKGLVIARRPERPTKQSRRARLRLLRRSLRSLLAMTRCRGFFNNLVIGKEVEESIEKVRQEGKTRVSGPAVFSLILSIFCFVIPVIGQLICFYVAGRVLYDIKQSNGLLKGKPLAISAIVISVLYLVAFAVLFLVIIPSSAPPR